MSTLQTQKPFELTSPEPKAIEPLSLVQQAMDKGWSGEQLNGLLEFAKNFKTEQAKEAYFRAFKAFKSNVPVIVKNAEIAVNRVVRSRYADLEQVCDKLIPALEAVGITHRWKTAIVGDKIAVTCLLRHEMGHEEEGSTLMFGPDTSGAMNAIQGMGSTVSYLERYTFLASCGVTVKGIDRDGNQQPATLSEEQSAKLGEWADALKECTDLIQLKGVFADAYKYAKSVSDQAKAQMSRVYEEQKRKLQ